MGRRNARTAAATLKAPTPAPVPLATPWGQTSLPVQVRHVVAITFTIFFNFIDVRLFFRSHYRLLIIFTCEDTQAKC